MTQPTARFGDYVLPRLRKVAPIDNLIYDELGEAVVRIHNEQFRGTPLEDTHSYRKKQPITLTHYLGPISPNPFAVINYDRIIHEQTNGRIRVASPADVVRFWDDIPERDATYAYTDSIALFSNGKPNQGLARKVCNILGISITSTTVPLLVAGLGIKRADTRSGFTFTETDLTKATAAPWLTRDQKVKYDPITRDLVAVEDDGEGVWAWVQKHQKHQSGLLKGYRTMNNGLDFQNDRLLNPSAETRVQIVQVDLKGRAA